MGQFVLTDPKHTGVSADAENNTPAAVRVVGKPFARGQSGNPGGRSKTVRDIQELARAHGPAAIATLAQALRSRNERVRVAAAAILLDRGYGKAPQALSVEGQAPLALLHLAAATEAGVQLLRELGAKPTEPQAAVIDLAALPAPTE